MTAPKVIKLLSVLILLVAGLLLGCTTSQRPSVSQEGATSTVSNEASGDTTEEVDSSSPQVEADTASETPSEAKGEVSSPVAADVEATVILMGDTVTTLDPYLMVNTHSDGSIASHVWDTLVLLNDELQLEPQLAESWRLVNNFTWEFKLRQGLKFHNDEPLTAEAVRFSIERAQTLPGSLETFAQDVGLEKVEVVNDYTLHLTTRQPVANLPYHLAFLEILPPLYYADTDPSQVAVAPVGSGPYQVASTEDGALVLDAAPGYWRGAPTLPRLIFKVMPEAEQRLAALAAGEASLVTDLPPTPADQWDVPNSRLEAIESTRRLFIGMRMGEGTPLANKQVRQALNYGVNVEEIINNNLAGYGQRYGSWVNPPANNPDLEPWPYDPDMARTLLAEAGYGEGITLTLRTPVDVYHQDVAIAQAVAAQLAEIGVTVEVDTIKNWDVYVRELLSGKSDPLFLLELNSRGDGLEDVLNMSQTFAFNPTGWRNESFEEAATRAIGTFNEGTRDRLMNEAQAIAYEEASWLWLWKPYDFYGVSQNLDWTPRRDGLINLYKPSTPPTESR